jgi:hypothetical protein
MEPAKTTEPKRRTHRTTAPRETGSRSTDHPRSSRRKAAEFSVPIKLWVSQDMYDALQEAATEREWSVPQVIRRALKDATFGKRKPG